MIYLANTLPGLCSSRFFVLGQWRRGSFFFPLDRFIVFRATVISTVKATALEDEITPGYQAQDFSPAKRTPAPRFFYDALKNSEFMAALVTFIIVCRHKIFSG